MCGNVTNWTKGYCPVCAAGGFVISGAFFNPLADRRYHPYRARALGKDLILRSSSGKNTNKSLSKGPAKKRKFSIYRIALSKTMHNRFQSPIQKRNNSSGTEQVSGEQTEGAEAPSPTSRLNAYNRFFTSVFGKRTWFSGLLIQSGISRGEIKRWKKDFRWIHAFMSLFQAKIERDLRKFLPECKPAIIRWHYGLDGEPALATNDIAKRLSIDTNTASEMKYTLVKLLRSEKGKALVRHAATNAAESVK